ncbi:MAG: ABC transporter ATP-binding protein [Nitrospirota bacterium]|nr:ABC transporter ATP-binding protein [Nitrospirota bacterium]
MAKLKPPTQTRRVLTYAHPYWRTLSLATLCLLLSSGISLSLPWLLRDPVNIMLAQKSIPDVNIFIALIVLFFIQALFSFAHNYLSGSVGQRVLADLRVGLFSHLQSLSLHFFLRRRTGELLSRLTNDLAEVQTLATELPVNIVRQGVILVGGISIILVMNWRLSLLAFFLIPVIIFFARFMGRRLKALSTAVQDHLAQTTTLMEEMISGIRSIKSFGREVYEKERFSQQTDKTLTIMLKRLKISAAFGPLMVFLGFSTACGLMWYGAREVFLGKLSPGELIAFIMYAVIITGPVGSFARLFSKLQEGLGASRRVFELLDTVPKISDQCDARRLPLMLGAVDFNQVCFHYIEGQPVLQKVSFKVAPGEKVALIGPSGAGKSTLIHLLHRFYDPISGEILIDGRPLLGLQLKSYYDQIAYVPQEVVLFGGTLRDNILYGKLHASEVELISASKAAYAHDFIMAFPEGYETIVGEKGLTLSGGQRHRIAIARAFLKNPRMLILDEATAYLDNESERFIQAALGNLMKDKTTFMIAHRLTTIQQADRILVFNHGALAEEGNHQQLMTKRGLYHHLYTLKQDGVLASPQAV